MYELFIILGLIVLNGILSMTEMSLVSSRKSKLETQSRQGDKKSGYLLHILDNPDKFLSTIQIGITIIGILNGIFSGEEIKQWLIHFYSQFRAIAPASRTLATITILFLITYFTLVFGELVPKRIGLSNPEKISKKMLNFMRVVSTISYPFIVLLTFSSRIIAKIFKIRSADNVVTEEEIKTMLNVGTEQGEIEEEEQKIIERVFHLGDRNITSLMTHRSEIQWLGTRMSKQEIDHIVNESRHTVYPLCGNNVDDIKGFIKTADLYASSGTKHILELSRPALFVPESNSAYQVMQKFKDKGVGNCYIVDEYGSLQGMVTMKDILEAIVGDINELDEAEEDEIVKREDGTYWVEAQMHFYDFLDYFECEDDYDDSFTFDTLAGFILFLLNHIPKEGEIIEWKDFVFEIADMDGNKIDKILVTRKGKELKTENILSKDE